ncbi:MULTISPECIES: hypothetical protein [unclassified Mycoplasma]|uniref:hypothetical protein n=1 Tax=unclassified Mycoplasma TaxID=2683645 RepID=UPI00211BE3C3|nr:MULTISPECIES: hypothetical protein [unclassified Mycoplasma]UUM19987.1 hypothetical protein NPA11_00930 [Mycoplasma sp. 1578d]UUM24968.1 hypothetical protein NPA12_00915 [Mycoplasma sp. 3686d]
MKRKLALILSVFGGVITPLSLAVSCSNSSTIVEPKVDAKQEEKTEEPKKPSPEEVAKLSLLKETVSTNEKLLRMSENVLVISKDKIKDKLATEASVDDVYLEFGKLYYDYAKQVDKKVILVSSEGTQAKFSVRLSKTLSNGKIVSVAREVTVPGYKEEVTQ